MVKQIRKLSGGDDLLKNLNEKLANEKIEKKKLHEIMISKIREADAAKASINPLKSKTFYNIFSSILLISSYILFGVSSVIFINTCIHFNKAYIEDIVNVVKDPVDTSIEKPVLINQPIFEYLKPINYLSIDNFLLYYDNINTPFFWVFSIIIIISFICVTGNIIFWALNNSKKNYDIWKYELFGDTSKIISFIILLIPYIYIFLISATFNSEQKKIIPRLNNVSILGRQYKGYEEFKPQIIKNDNFVNELKKIIIHCINNEIKHEDINEYIKNLLKSSSYNQQLFINLINKTTIVEDIIAIYHNDYKIEIKSNYKDEDEKKSHEKKIKDEKMKFINYIDEYFNILNDDKSTDINYYARYYLLGLIKDNNIANSNDIMKKLINYKVLLNKELIAIKNDIFKYYVTVIVFYVLFLIVIIILNFNYIINTIFELLFMYKIYFNKVLLSVIILIIIHLLIFRPKI
jgi:hypothetical protein